MANGIHDYSTRVIWDGNSGEGTSGYASYGRRYRVLVTGKHEITGSADPAFRGDADRHNPEDLFLASISACHMLFYLALCARKGVRVEAYEDDARGRLVLDASGGGRFEDVTLRPRVILADELQQAVALELHETAHRLCFIANSCGVPIRIEANVSGRT